MDPVNPVKECLMILSPTESGIELSYFCPESKKIENQKS